MFRFKILFVDGCMFMNVIFQVFHTGFKST